MRPAAHLQALIGSHTWDKELLMWIGSENALQDALGSANCVTLDLLDLFDPADLPSDDEATRAQLRDGLRQELRAIQHGPGDRVVLVVKSIGLLARYNVGLQAFYNWFIGDFAMVLLLLEGGTGTAAWPEEVRCEGDRVLTYFSEPGMVKRVFNTSG